MELIRIKMFLIHLVATLTGILLVTSQLVSGDLTGQNPGAGSCICLDNTGVNVRSSPCGTVIGSASTPQCFVGNGKKQACVLNGVNYEFFAMQYGSQEGWMAGTYLQIGSSSQCTGSGDGNCAQLEIVYRSQWGARAPTSNVGPLPNKPVGMGFVHHTVTSSCTTIESCSQLMRSMQNYDMDVRGYSDIGYNYLVAEDGRAYEGRQWDKLGGHTYGYNNVGVAVSVIGDYTSRAPNAAAQRAVKNAFACAIRAGVLRSNYEMFGHRDAGCTACPGDSFYPVIRTWSQYSFRTIPKYCMKEDD